MVEVVESSIDRIEEAIFELDTGNSSIEETPEPFDDGSHPGGARAARRTVWLNTAFLRNKLHIWKTQMSKMMEHVDELYAKMPSDANENGNIVPEIRSDPEKGLLQTGNLIKDRLRTMIEEFEEKMEDCTMRVDGMAMATQWVRITAWACKPIC